MDKIISKWAPGASYGPVLSQTDLYLLNTDLEVNPIFDSGKPMNQFQFHLVTGFPTSGSRVSDADGSIVGKNEPATLPRVARLVVISRLSPWCTIVANDSGVTVEDVFFSDIQRLQRARYHGGRVQLIERQKQGSVEAMCSKQSSICSTPNATMGILHSRRPA